MPQSPDQSADQDGCRDFGIDYAAGEEIGWRGYMLTRLT